MSNKQTFDLDEALASLARDVQASEPQVSLRLKTAVLGDAASAASELVANSQSPKHARAAARGFRLFDWLSDRAGVGVAAAAAVVMLVALGVGYEAGPELLSEFGLNSGDVTLADAGGIFPSDDTL